MKNTRLRFFVDTTVAISALTGRNDDAWALLESGRRGLILLLVNEFVIKEIRWTLKEFHISQEKINMEDAKKYIESMTPGNALKKLS